MKSDDPKLTAFALGELDDAERQAVEALLRADAGAAAEVAEVREFSTLLRRVLVAENAPPLQAAQREELLAAAAGPAAHEARTGSARAASEAAAISPAQEEAHEKVIRPSRWRFAWLPTAIAACVALATGVMMKQNEAEKERERRELPAPLPESKNSAADAHKLAQPAAASRAGGTAGEGPELSGAVREHSLPMASATPAGTASHPSAETAERDLGPQLDKAPRLASAAPGSPVLTPLKNVSAMRLLPHAAPGGLPAVSNDDLKSGASPLAQAPPPASADADQFTNHPRTTSLTGGTLMPLDSGVAPVPPASPSERTVADKSSIAAPAKAKNAEGGKESQPATRSGKDWKLERAWDRPVRKLDETGRPVMPVSPAASTAVPQRSGNVSSSGSEKRFGSHRVLVRDGHERPEGGIEPERSPIQPADQSKSADLEKAKTGRPDRLYKSVDELLYEQFEPPQIPQKFGEPAATKAIAPAPEPANTESYDTVTDNPFLTAKENPLSTFSIDVDSASYTNVRRFLTQGQRPPKGAVRIEELINYFTYSYPQPAPGEPFSVSMEVATCPWAPERRLLRVGLKAREIPRDERPAANLVFLIDVSGSMQPANKLPLVKESLRLLIEQLGPKDTVAIAVYAGASGTVLEPTSDKAAIRAALDRLEAGGSTNGGAGIRLAYELARRSLDKEKTNRVILATDGDFNVGTTSQSDLVDLITKQAKSGVFLTVLGFGYGNLKDSTMEKLADKGNGNYAYIDSIAEGRRVLVEQMAGTLITVAKDVKLQLEFNPAQVSGYRLIGYENRVLQKEDFNDDKKDAGEIGAGHTVTALYEIVPANVKLPAITKVDPLKYQPAPQETPAVAADTANAPAAAQPISNELLTLKLRWKAPDSDTSTLREVPLTDSGVTWEKSSRDFRWAAAVASFGMLLRDSPYKGGATWESTRELAVEGQGDDAGAYRTEFLKLIEKASALAR